MANGFPTWDEWLAGLTDEDRGRALALRDRFVAVGADEPQSWARSEVSEGIPQMGRFLFLRSLWSKAINSWQEPGSIDIIPVANGLLRAGVDRADLVMLARRVAFETVLRVISLLDEGQPFDQDDPTLPGWCLHETGYDGTSTGRCIGGLHESILETDPSGQEAEDLME